MISENVYLVTAYAAFAAFVFTKNPFQHFKEEYFKPSWVLKQCLSGLFEMFSLKICI